MRALQIVKPREFRIVELERPQPGPNDIVVELEYAAICNQNDYKIFYGLYGDLITYPCDPGVYGHEGVGIVVETGSAVDNLAVGDRVVLMMEGGPMLYMEYVLRRADSVVRIDKDIPAEEAAVLELFGCAHHCSEIVGQVSGKSVAVSGLGPAGLAIAQVIALNEPAELIGIEPCPDRGNTAREFGVQRIVDPTKPAELQALIEEGVDIVVDATGIPQAILNAFDITRKEVVIFGFTNKPFEVDQSKWFHKEMVIKNSKVQTIDDLRAAVALLETGKIRVRSFIDDIMSFDDYDKAVERVYQREAVKILLEWK